MKILASSDVPYFFVAGSNSFLRQLAPRMRDRGHALGILCASRSPRPELYVDDGTPVFGVSSLPSILQPSFRIALPVGIHRQLVNAFDRFQPDLLHVHSHGPLPASAVAVARHYGLPVVGTNHFVPDNIIHQLFVPTPFHSSLKRLMWRHLRSTYERLDRVTTPTDTAQRIAYEAGFQRPVTVISNGVDLSRFCKPSPSDRSQDALCEKYGLQRKPTLLSVGRLDPEKNTAFLIEVISHVIPTLDMQLVIVGTGTKGRQLKALVRSRHLENHAIFTDYVTAEDLPALYRLANCFIMPGSAELQGIALMEAMASGLPVLAADQLALPELVGHGENGFLFSPDDPEIAARHVITLLTDDNLRARMGSKSLERIQRHDISHTVDAFEALYQDVLQRHSRPRTAGWS